MFNKTDRLIKKLSKRQWNGVHTGNKTTIGGVDVTSARSLCRTMIVLRDLQRFIMKSKESQIDISEYLTSSPNLFAVVPLCGTKSPQSNRDNLATIKTLLSNIKSESIPNNAYAIVDPQMGDSSRIDLPAFFSRSRLEAKVAEILADTNKMAEYFIDTGIPGGKNSDRVDAFALSCVVWSRILIGCFLLLCVIMYWQHWLTLPSMLIATNAWYGSTGAWFVWCIGFFPFGGWLKKREIDVWRGILTVTKVG